MDIRAGFICDRGLNPKRPVNQDRLLVLPERGVFAVFDGVGGQRAGEVASQTAAETIEEAITHTSAESPEELVERAVRFANRDVFELAESDPSYKTMATTVALLHIADSRATIGHVGDSRVYRLTEGRLCRETIDHTDLNDALRSGIVHRGQKATPLEARNVINRALGVDRDVDVEIKTLKIREGDRFLLCSDGVYTHIPDEEIGRVLAESKEPQLAADELKKLVHTRGADDNLSAVVVQIGRARTGPVLEVDDGLPKRKARSTGSLEVSPATAGRIEVDFDHSPRSDGRRFERRLDLDEGRRVRLPSGGESVGRSMSTRLMVVLLVLVLMAAAFYAGVRTSDWVKARTSNKRPPSSAAEQMSAAKQQFERGDVAAAEAAFASIVSRDPENAKAHYWLGRAQFELGKHREAAASFEQAIRIDSKISDAYVQAAAAYEALGEKAKAANMLTQFAEAKRQQGAPQTGAR